jgi:hypothetical protein
MKIQTGDLCNQFQVFTLIEYSELKELSYELTRRRVRKFEKEREAGTMPVEEDGMELIEVKPALTVPGVKSSGVRLKVGAVDIRLEKNFDRSVLSEVLKVLGAV